MIKEKLTSYFNIVFEEEIANNTSNIDIKGCEQVYQTLEKLNKDITVVVISHDISVVLKYATKAVYINKKLTYHDLSKMKNDFKNIESHVCEIELLEMLGKCKC